GDGCHVDSPLAAQTEPDAVIRQFAQKCRRLDAGDTQSKVHNALAVFVERAGAEHVLVSHPQPCQTAFSREIGNGGAKQQDLGGLDGKTDLLRDGDGVGAGKHQFARQLKGGSAGGTVAKAACIREHRGVETRGHLEGDRGSGGAHEAMDELADAGRGAIDPVEAGVGPAAGMVVDVDEEERVETVNPGAANSVALQQNYGIVRTTDAHGGADAAGAGQPTVDGGDAVGCDQIGSLAHLFEQYAHGQHAADGIAVR